MFQKTAPWCRPATGFRLFGVLVCVLVLWGCGDDEPEAQAPKRTWEAVVAEWQLIVESDERLHLAEEMIRDNHLIGRNKEDVVAQLGKPHGRYLPGYGDIKYIVGPSGIDDLWLCIYLEGEQVALAKIRSD